MGELQHKYATKNHKNVVFQNLFINKIACICEKLRNLLTFNVYLFPDSVLSGKNLSGMIPSEIAQLDQLTELYVIL